MRRRRYPSDLADPQWPLLVPHIPPAKAGGRPRTTDLRAVLDAILYLLRTGCQWRQLAADFRPGRRCTAISGAGASPASGPSCTVRSTHWTAPRLVPRVGKGGRRRERRASGPLVRSHVDPDWVDADMKLIVAAWSRDRLLVARIDGSALPVGLRDQPCHELRSGQLDRDIGKLTLATLALDRAPEGKSIKVRSWRATFSVVLLLALGGLAWFLFTKALTSPFSAARSCRSGRR